MTSQTEPNSKEPQNQQELEGQINFDQTLHSLKVSFEVYDWFVEKQNKHFSPYFNYIELMLRRTAHPENTISDFTAFLLNPDETHGQNDIFLRCFLQIVLKNSHIMDTDSKNINVYREYVISDNNRIDILIELDSMIIAIENKLRTKDSEGQIDNYIKWLQNKKRKYIMVYLTLDGEKPEQSTLWKNSSDKTLKYSIEIKKWLEDCLIESKSEKIKDFINEFINWICIQDGGSLMFNQNDLIKDYMSKSEEHFALIYKLFQFKFEDYLKVMKETFRKEMIDNLRNRLKDGWVVEDKNAKFLVDSNGCIKIYRKSWPGGDWPAIYYGIQADLRNKEIVRIYFGVVRGEEKKRYDNEKEFKDAIRQSTFKENLSQEYDEWWVVRIDFSKINEIEKNDSLSKAFCWHICDKNRRAEITKSFVEDISGVIELTKEFAERVVKEEKNTE